MPLTLALLLLACAQPSAPPAPREAPAPAGAVAPVTADTSKAEVEARRQALFAQIRAWVGELDAAGRYDCCVKVPCSHCAVMAGGCRCGEGLRRGEPVCEECALMWAAGQGDEPGVDAGAVRSFLEASRPGNGHGPQRVCEHDNVGRAGEAPVTGASGTP